MKQHVAGGLPRQTLFRQAVAAAADCFEGKKKRKKKEAAFVQHMGAFIVEEKK